MSSYLSERVEANPRIRLRLYHELRAVEGIECMERVHLENTTTGECRVEESAGIFIFIGATPGTDFLGISSARMPRAFFSRERTPPRAVPGRSLHANPARWRPRSRGVFVAGDCRSSTGQACRLCCGRWCARCELRP